MYRIQVGCFGSRSSASKTSIELDDLGFNSYITQEEDCFKVFAGSCVSYTQAKKISRLLDHKGFSNLIKTYDSHQFRKFIGGVTMNQKKVFIDVGHGGSDSGAVGNGMAEKNVNLVVALKLKEVLESNGFLVRISRASDITLSLEERVKMANDWGADIFISVHHNAGGGDGAECVHSIYHGVGEALAKEVMNQFLKLGQNSHAGAYSKQGKNGDYYAVIRDTNMPAIITEFGFIDTQDAQAFDTDPERYQEAEAIAKAVCTVFKVPFLTSAVKVLPTSTVTSLQVTATSGLNIRKGPGANYIKVGAYTYGQKITAVSKKNGWYQTKDGWISSDYVKAV